MRCGGERAAVAYTLIETAKLNGLDPEAYLREVIGRIADHPINRIVGTAALEHRRRIADPCCSLIFAVSSVTEPRELPVPRSYRYRLPL